MHARTRGTVAVVLAGLLALSGCAAATDAGANAPVATATPAAGAVEAGSSPTPEPSAVAVPAETAESATTAGAYVDYADGAIEATPGAKALFFHAPWCPKCRALDEDLRAVGAPDGLTVFKVDFDSRTDLRQKYGVTLQTTIVFVDDAGRAISSTVLYEDPSVASLVAAIP